MNMKKDQLINDLKGGLDAVRINERKLMHQVKELIIDQRNKADKIEELQDAIMAEVNLDSKITTKDSGISLVNEKANKLGKDTVEYLNSKRYSNDELAMATKKANMKKSHYAGKSERESTKLTTELPFQMKSKKEFDIEYNANIVVKELNIAISKDVKVTQRKSKIPKRIPINKYDSKDLKVDKCKSKIPKRINDPSAEKQRKDICPGKATTENLESLRGYKKMRSSNSKLPLSSSGFIFERDGASTKCFQVKRRGV